LSLLSQSTKGKQLRPQLITIYGPNKVGKSTWACSFPKPYVADIERGTHHLDVERFDNINDLATFKTLTREILETKHDFKTFVVDSVEALESLIFKDVCREGNVDSIEKYEKGFGKGYVRSAEYMEEIMHMLQAITQKRGMDVILIAHAHTKSHSDPSELTAYDRWTLRCNKNMTAVIKDLSDNIFFATNKVYVKKDGMKGKGIGDGERIIYTEWRPGFDAGNRLDLPFELPFPKENPYQAFKEALALAKPKTTEELKAEITELLKGIPASDEQLKTKVVASFEAAGNDYSMLLAIRDRLREKMKKGEV